MLNLYHRTSPEAAAEILASGRLVTRENTRQAYASTRPNGHAAGYGAAVVQLLVAESDAELDDEFPDGERHYRVPLDAVIVDAFLVDESGVCRPLLPAEV